MLSLPPVEVKDDPQFRLPLYALFDSELGPCLVRKNYKIDIIALLFVFDKYYPIMD